MEIKFAKIALKALQSYDRPMRERIRDRINGLILTPPVGDIKPIAGEIGTFRLRVGKFRIKYEYVMEETTKMDGSKDIAKVLRVIDINSRGDIYK